MDSLAVCNTPISQQIEGQAVLCKVTCCPSPYFSNYSLPFEQMRKWTDPPRYAGVRFLLVQGDSRLSVPHRAVAIARRSGFTWHAEVGKHWQEIQKQKTKAMEKTSLTKTWFDLHVSCHQPANGLINSSSPQQVFSTACVCSKVLI